MNKASNTNYPHLLNVNKASNTNYPHLLNVNKASNTNYPHLQKVPAVRFKRGSTKMEWKSELRGSEWPVYKVQF